MMAPEPTLHRALCWYMEKVHAPVLRIKGVQLAVLLTCLTGEDSTETAASPMCPANNQMSMPHAVPILPPSLSGLCLSLVAIPHLSVGLDQSVALPRDSYLQAYYK